MLLVQFLLHAYLFFTWVPVSPSQSWLILVSPGESYWMQILGDSWNSTRNGIICPGFLWDLSRNFSWIYSHLMADGWGTIPEESSRNTWGSVKSSLRKLMEYLRNAIYLIDFTAWSIKTDPKRVNIDSCTDKAKSGFVFGWITLNKVLWNLTRKGTRYYRP